MTIRAVFSNVVLFCALACNNQAAELTKIDSNVQRGTANLNQKNNFDAVIIEISSQVENVESWDALFKIKPFIYIYEHSDSCVSDAKRFLADSSYNDHKKKTCICSMQRASLSNYLQIVKSCKDLFDDHKLSENILAWSVSPNFSKAQPVVRNYESKEVSDLLQEIIADSNISNEFRDRIKQIKSGAVWDSIKGMEGS
ncbi:MAG TPA: hypothetical protein VMH27_20790 [Puia sp.]|nr:hypothetical protein [Puia sp.]